MSTAIQRGFFERHSSIYFGGVGINDNISYANVDLEEIFELALKYSHNHHFEANLQRYKSSLSQFLRRNTQHHPTVFSNEALSMNFSLQGIDSSEKLRRIKILFEECDIHFILFYKAPLSILRGIYKEYLKMGFDKNYQSYLEMLLVLKDRNFLADLNIQLKKRQLEKNVSSDRIHTFDLSVVDSLTVSEKTCLWLSEILGIEREVTDLPQLNESLSLDELSQLYNYNSKRKIGMGRNCNEPFERHRSKIAFYNSGVNFENDFIFENVLDKREALKEFYKEDKVEHFFESSEIEKLEKKVLEIVNSFG